MQGELKDTHKEIAFEIISIHYLLYLIYTSAPIGSMSNMCFGIFLWHSTFNSSKVSITVPIIMQGELKDAHKEITIGIISIHYLVYLRYT